MNEEDLGIASLPAQAERAVVLAEIGTCRSLLGHLDVVGLELVRRRLKTPDVVRVCALGNGAELRAELLDATCRRLAELGRAPEIYYAGEMLPDVPDICPNGEV